MWLLDTKTLELHEFIGSTVPPYAILSHVWGADEVSFTEMKKAKHRDAAKKKSGFSKIEGICTQAVRDGYQWAWVDSCCIDKRSSAELSEAINSMFAWYRRSRRCYVYLADVGHAAGATHDVEFKCSRWLRRGWTLQELLAPVDTVFFAQDWTPIGQTKRHKMRHMPSGLGRLGKSNMFGNIASNDQFVDDYYIDDHFTYPDITTTLAEITGIPTEILTGEESIFSTCIAQRMYWASRRETTRPEDGAYSLMGMFDISMPILYGEGLQKAFTRLQHEILSKSDDHTIFAWYRPSVTTYNLLAESPDDFRNSGTVRMVPYRERVSISRTNIGLSITLYLAGNNPASMVEGQSVRAFLRTTVDRHNGLQENIVLTLNLVATEVNEKQYTFYCVRPGTWTLRNDGEVPDKYTRVYIEY